MTRPRIPRLVAALLVALGAGCGGHQATVPYPAPACQLPAPQPSALPTFTPATAPPLTREIAISFGVQAAGQTVSFTVPAGTASVTIVEQAAASTNPLVVQSGTTVSSNTPVPLGVQVSGNPTPIFWDVPMPPSAALPVVNGLTVLDPLSDPSLPSYFFSAGAWTGALTLPSISRKDPATGIATVTAPPPGTWTVTVGDWAYECRTFPSLACSAAAGSAYDVTVILKPASAPASSLKVVFYLVTASGLTVANAPSNLDVARMEWAMGKILGAAGITPSFQFRDVPAAVRAVYATGVDASGGACGAMGQLLQLAEPGNQLNVFLVDRIKDAPAGGFITLGLDPIVPGPASFGGTPASGVLVSLVDLGAVTGSPGCQPVTPTSTPDLANCGDDITGAIVAHEAGHFMGLQHTTEAIGTIVDPIADTPTCLCPLCKPAKATQACQGVGSADPKIASPYHMQVGDCLAPTGSTPECGGGDNLMFWLIDAGSKGVLSVGQAAVMRASPLVE